MRLKNALSPQRVFATAQLQLDDFHTIEQETRRLLDCARGP
jgi:hypothetical protein